MRFWTARTWRTIFITVSLMIPLWYVPIFQFLKWKNEKKTAFYRAAMYNVIGNRLNFCNRIVKLWREIDSSRKKLKISTGHGTLSNFGKKIYNHIRFNLFYAISIFIYLFIIFNKPKIIDIDFVSNFLK